MLKSRIGFMVVAAGIVLSACSHSASEKGVSASLTTAPGGTSPGAQNVLAGAKVPKGQPLTASRQIVYTGHLEVRVTDVVATSDRAETIVDGTAGYLFSQDANLQGHTDETLVFKVPPTQFATVLDRLAALGTPLDKQIGTSDVTDQVVDLEGRLQTATASAARLRALFAGAQNVPDVVAIENDLATRESEVESLQGQLRLVKNQVQLATITLALTTKTPAKKTTTPSFTRALSAGWTAFADTIKVIVATVGATLPFLVVAAAIAAIATAVRRRRRRPSGLDAQGSVV
jgi:Domain of unknown function (DUF4349)